MATNVIVRHAATGATVCPHCEVADTLLTRFRGLMRRETLEPGHGLLLRPSSSIHTGFMRFAIDAVFLDEDLRVLSVTEHMGPWRLAASRGAKGVLELRAGEWERTGLRVGAWLALEPATPAEPADRAEALAA